MIDLAADLFPVAESALWAFWAVFLRVSGTLSLLPAFGEQTVPVRLRLGLAVAFTFVVAPAVTPRIGPDPGLFGGFALSELAVGLFFGVMLRLFVLALQIAGSIAAQSTSLSQIFGGSAGMDPMPAMGHILVTGGLALAVMLGLHVRAAAFMIESYALIPPGTLPDPALVARVGLAEVGRCFATGFSLAAPFIVTSLIYNVTLGVINKAMPQLMVAFVGAPAITAGGLALLAIAAPMMLNLWVGGLNAFLAAPFGDAP